MPRSLRAAIEKQPGVGPAGDAAYASDAAIYLKGTAKLGMKKIGYT